MEAYSTQVIELLSLGKTSDGAHQLKVMVTREDKQDTYELEIDEFTFRSMEALHPLSGGRARISPYAKWDPFRKGTYSSIVRTTGSLRETLYFVCSETYINQIQHIRQLSLQPGSALDIAGVRVWENEVPAGHTAADAVPAKLTGQTPGLKSEAIKSSSSDSAKKLKFVRTLKETTDSKTDPTADRTTARFSSRSKLLAASFIILVGLALPYFNKIGQMDVFGSRADAARGIETVQQAKEAVSPALLTVQKAKTKDVLPPANTAAGQADGREGQAGAAKTANPSGMIDAKSATSSDYEAADLKAANSKSYEGIAGKAADSKGYTAAAANSAAPKGYDVIDVPADKKLFGLPKGYVALTFDDGPSRYTEKIVDILTQSKVAATFLFIGENAKRNPDAVVYASKQGMSVGNHSWDHKQLTKIKADEQSRNLSDTVRLLESLTGEPLTLFRPPYGAVDEGLFAEAGRQHMKTLMWNRDPEDWNHKKPEDIVRYFHQLEASGGIYVLHEDKNTVEALPDILKYLKGQNLKFAIFK